jgi:hypothetical protein
MAVRQGEVRTKEKLMPVDGVETGCDYDHPNEDSGKDETLHEALPAGEGGHGSEHGEGEGSHGCGDGVSA